MLEGNTKGAILVVTYERWHTTTYIGVVRNFFPIMTAKQLTSKYHDFAIDFLALDEPNYGREIWRVKLNFNGQDVTEELLEHWNYLHNISEERYSIDSLDEKSIYIPAELNSIIFLPESFGKYKVLKPSNPLQEYIGNVFGQNKLIELYTKTVIVTDLIERKSKAIALDADKRVEWGTINTDNKLEISFRIVEIKGSVERIKTRGTELIII